MTASPLTALDAAQVGAHLAQSLPHWCHEDGFIVRTYRTASWKGAMMVANTVGHLCEAAWHHPDMEVSFGKVTVKLQTHDASGITLRDLELALQIERVVQWQPGLAGGALTGTPNGDERFAYIRYD